MTDSFGIQVPTGSGTQGDPRRFERLSAIQRGMRSTFNTFHPTSIYSQNMNPNLSMVNGPSTTPRATRLFGGRLQTRSHEERDPHASTSHLPANSQPVPMTYSPVALPTGWDSEADDIHLPRAAVLPDSRPIGVTAANVSRSAFSSAPSGSAFTAADEGRSGVSAETRSSRNRDANSQRRHRKKKKQHTQRRRPRLQAEQRVWTRSVRSGPSTVSSRRTAYQKGPKTDTSKLSVILSTIFLLITVITCKPTFPPWSQLPKLTRLQTSP
jgi:hypothetical protein